MGERETKMSRIVRQINLFHFGGKIFPYAEEGRF